MNPLLIRRPRWLTILLLLCAILQMFSAVQVLRLPPELAEKVSLLLPLEFVLGGLWALSLSYFALKAGTIRARVVLLQMFIAYHVARLMLFARADYDRGRIPFLVMTLGVLIFIGGVVSWHNPAQPQELDEQQGE